MPRQAEIARIEQVLAKRPSARRRRTVAVHGKTGSQDTSYCAEDGAAGSRPIRLLCVRLRHAGEDLPAEHDVDLRALPRGVTLGVVDLVDVVQYAEVARPGLFVGSGDPFDLAADPWATGPICWILRRPRPLAEPVPWRGERGLWSVDPADVPGLREVIG